KYINFLIGGGAHEGKTCMNLLVENEVVRTSTGKDSEELVWETWEVEEFQGKNAKIEIVDAHSEGWGHINVDDITFSDFPAKSGEDKAVWLDYGRDNYAGVTWSNIPKEDGRRLFIGWMSNWDYATLVPTENWRSAMTLPRSLHLMQVDDNYELWQKPVAELQKLRSNTTELSAQVLEEQLDLSTVAVDFSSGILEFELELEVSDKSVFSMKIMNNNDEYYTISYDEAKGELISDKRYSGKIDFSDRFANQIHTAPLKLEGDKLKLQGFLDVASGEIFANDGKVVMTEIFFPNKNYNKIVLEATKGTVSLTKGTFHNLN
ncbi:MAG: GH32 C-terminal domain-containing protein, partial [Bacteroidota bacterium]